MTPNEEPKTSFKLMPQSQIPPITTAKTGAYIFSVAPPVARAEESRIISGAPVQRQTRFRAAQRCAPDAPGAQRAGIYRRTSVYDPPHAFRIPHSAFCIHPSSFILHRYAASSLRGGPGGALERVRRCTGGALEVPWRRSDGALAAILPPLHESRLEHKRRYNQHLYVFPPSDAPRKRSF
jgi:hypothetical protein